jgi:hypothetical protein
VYVARDGVSIRRYVIPASRDYVSVTRYDVFAAEDDVHMYL